MFNYIFLVSQCQYKDNNKFARGNKWNDQY